MKWYLKVVRDNYANFKGRARRKEYWMFTLFNIIFLYALVLISAALVSATDTIEFLFLYFIYFLAIFIPSLAVGIRRLHDVGKSGWFYLIGLIPFIGGIWLFVLFITEGDKGPNQYGVDPKAPNTSEIENIGKPLIE
ncbi:DUF805 domain-containing protein [Seonamhaeicola maritimus]|uniref:DUF805 domain-containing protein n=1 Tax=Seonamhaeicola maritimus TaxID=2591822 RepID=UPI0024949E3E|nr:DUF805 domain-containing protein [Seonamhaeicola maritimus]